ncbi:MAG: hypothetical protein ACK4UQ_03500 [Brevundimonas sp.]
MIRILAAASGLAVLAFAGVATAQTLAPSWGQPVYLDSWGRPVGGTPLSEVETRSNTGTGRWADGYGEQAYVHVPGRAPRYAYGRDRTHGYDRDGYDRRPDQGYRDEWGYSNDRARPGRQGYVNGDRSRYDDGPDVYFYDR